MNLNSLLLTTAACLGAASAAGAQQPPPIPESQYDNPWSGNFVAHKVNVTPVAAWTKVDLTPFGLQEDTVDPNDRQTSWVNGNPGNTGKVEQHGASGFDVHAMSEVFDNAAQMSQAVSMAPLGFHQEYWEYEGNLTGDVEEGCTVKVDGVAESIKGLSRALVWAVTTYNSSFLAKNAEDNAAVQSTAGVGGATTVGWSVGGGAAGVSIAGSGSFTTNIHYTTGNAPSVMQDFDSGFAHNDAVTWGLNTKCKAKNESFADGADMDGIAQSHARADLRGYVEGTVILGEHQ